MILFESSLFQINYHTFHLVPVHSTLVRFPRHSVEIKSIAELPGAVGRIENSSISISYSFIKLS